MGNFGRTSIGSERLTEEKQEVKKKKVRNCRNEGTL